MDIERKLLDRCKGHSFPEGAGYNGHYVMTAKDARLDIGDGPFLPGDSEQGRRVVATEAGETIFTIWSYPEESDSFIEFGPEDGCTQALCTRTSQFLIIDFSSKVTKVELHGYFPDAKATYGVAGESQARRLFDNIGGYPRFDGAAEAEAGVLFILIDSPSGSMDTVLESLSLSSKSL